jgi:hypothetical protein
MFLILSSNKRITLSKLATGVGKSLMFGLMSNYINEVYNTKVAVIVPNEVLAAIQQDKYAPWASRCHDDLWKNKKDIHYCTYEDFASGRIPKDTILLVDEIDSLFFSEKPEIRGDKFLSVIHLLNQY